MKNPIHNSLSSITRKPSIQQIAAADSTWWHLVKKLNIFTVHYHIGDHRTLNRHVFQNHVIFHDILSDATLLKRQLCKLVNTPETYTITQSRWRVSQHLEIHHQSGATYQMEYTLRHIDTLELGCVMGNALATKYLLWCLEAGMLCIIQRTD